jgi:hypothetical protein
LDLREIVQIATKDSENSFGITKKNVFGIVVNGGQKVIEFRTETTEEMSSWILAIDNAAGSFILQNFKLKGECNEDWLAECIKEESEWNSKERTAKWEVGENMRYVQFIE